MSYRNLERIQSLMSTKSTSDFGVGHSTARIKSNFEDGSGALAKIKSVASKQASWAANVYCMQCTQSRMMLTIFIDGQIKKWFEIDGKRKSEYVLRLTEIALEQVFNGKYQTLEQCGDKLGMSKVGYTKTWQKYVDDAVAILVELLFTANIVAGDYFYDETHNTVKNEIKITY